MTVGPTDKAFRHGDIENILETLVKSAGGAASGGLLGFSASSLIRRATGGKKFNKSDVKKVYFVNQDISLQVFIAVILNFLLFLGKLAS